MTNNNGNKGHPCRTPASSLKPSTVTPPWRTLQNELSYNALMKLSAPFGIPICSSTVIMNSCEIEGNAAQRAKTASVRLSSLTNSGLICGTLGDLCCKH